MPMRRIARLKIFGALVWGSFSTMWGTETAGQSILVPSPEHSWLQAAEIVGKGANKDILYNDFSLTLDRMGRWHCIGIIAGPSIDSGELFHSIANTLQGPYVPRENLRVKTTTGRQVEMWAPSVIWAPDGRALMFYACGIHEVVGDKVDFQMRVLESDKYLDNWKPVNDPSLREGNILFEETLCRDPEAYWDADRREFLLYYVSGAGERTGGNRNVVRVRSSKDLLHWSEPKTVLTTPPGYQAAESVFVLHRDGLYYLWVSGFDYGRISLYISRDPLKFGDPVRNRIQEQSGHAPEIVSDQGRDWMACVRIASHFGNKPAEADLLGVYLQPLKWTPMDASELGKILGKPMASGE